MRTNRNLFQLFVVQTIGPVRFISGIASDAENGKEHSLLKRLNIFVGRKGNAKIRNEVKISEVIFFRGSPKWFKRLRTQTIATCVFCFPPTSKGVGGFSRSRILTLANEF